MIAENGLFKFGNVDVLKVYKGTVTRWVAPSDEPVVPQNLITYSEQYNNASWNKLNGGTITANAINGPDATLTADLYTASSSQYGNIVRKQVTYTNQQYTHSVHLKRNNWDYVGLRINNSILGERYPFINLTTLATDTLGVSGASMGVENLADDWVRVWLTFTPTAGFLSFDTAIVTSNGSSNIAMAGTESVYLWGSQLNEGPVRDYSKTEASIIP